MKSKEIHCVAGCVNYYGGEIYHHKDCPFYPDSFSRRYDELKSNMIPSLDLLQAELENGAKIKLQNNYWNLVDSQGKNICFGKTIRDMLINLIFVKC